MTLRILSLNDPEYWANSGSPQDIQNAINEAQAAGGGTVYIPEGDFTFNPSGIIGPANTPTGVISYGGINIIGAGIGKTILRETKDPPLINGYGTSMIAVDGRNNKPFRISGISFVGFVSSEDYGNTALELDSCLDYRVDHCEFDSFSGQSVVAQNIGGHNRGLVDHCAFSASYKLKSPPAGTEWQWGYGIIVWDEDYTAWSDIGTLLGKYEGADDIIYVEDCTFKQLRHAIANSQNGYYVIRHCTIENAIPPNFGQIDIHGFNCGRGCEAYDNTVIATSGYPAAQAVWLRGGTGTIFNNTFVNHAYGVMLFRETVAVPPYTHQNPVTDTYIWNNIMQGGGIAFSDQDAYTENADYFLYARPNYTPFPYPHPLALEVPTTPFSSELEEGVYTISMPESVKTGLDTYSFSHWEDGSTNPVRTINLTSDMAITAAYEKTVATHTLTVTARAGGTTSPAPGSYSYTEGASVTVTAIPDPGYKFANWLLDGAARTGNPITITMDTDHTLEAVFEYVPPPPLTATIKGVITDKTTGSPVPAATVTCDGYADITEADGSYVFENIPAQKYTLKVAKEGYIEAALSIDASAGGTAIIDIPISPAPKAPVFKIPITPLPLIVGAIITYLGQKKG